MIALVAMSTNAAPFKPSTLADWHKAAAKSAPGGDVVALNWVTPDGIAVKPLYTAEDVKDLPHANTLPGNGANDLYSKLTTNPVYRNSSQVQSQLTALGLLPVQDFEKTFARKLQSTDYFFNPQIGFISLNQPLQPDEVLGSGL